MINDLTLTRKKSLVNNEENEDFVIEKQVIVMIHILVLNEI